MYIYTPPGACGCFLARTASKINGRDEVELAGLAKAASVGGVPTTSARTTPFERKDESGPRARKNAWKSERGAK